MPYHKWRGALSDKIIAIIKKVKVINEDKEKSGLTWDLNNSKTIYSFSSQVLARSRLKMFKLLEALLDFEGLDICYVNTDSVHVSIPAVSQNNFLKDILTL